MENETIELSTVLAARFNDTMAAVKEFDDKKADMLKNVNEFLNIAKPHINRLSEKIGYGEVPCFRVSDDLAIYVNSTGDATAASIYKKTMPNQLEEIDALCALKSEEIVEKYGDEGFMKLICQALDKKRNHYNGINIAHKNKTVINEYKEKLEAENARKEGKLHFGPR